MDVKRKLAEYVREQSRRRASKAEEDRADERSERSAERLRRLAEHVEKLSDDDPRLRALAHVQVQHDSEEFVAGDDGAYLISRFAFDRADAEQDLDEFLTKLTRVIVAADRRTQVRDLDAQLDSREVDALLEQFGDAPPHG